MFTNKLFKLWTLGGLKTLILKTDANSNIEQCLGSGRPHTVCIAANINDVADLVLSQDRCYKFVLLLKDDRMNTHCDILTVLTFMLLNLYLIIT